MTKKNEVFKLRFFYFFSSESVDNFYDFHNQNTFPLIKNSVTLHEKITIIYY
jgi:hypothetical protein